MEERFDAIVVGAGPGGEAVAYRLNKAGKRVALVERELIGGACVYWACNPTKTLLRPTALLGESMKCFGTRPVELHWPEISQYRDEMVRGWDDSKQIRQYEESGVTVVKAEGRLDGPGVVVAGDRRLHAPDIVLATGSDPFVPPIEGLKEAGYWTNREAIAVKRIPESLAIVGGGPVGVEIGQMLRRYGAEVTIVEMAEKLFPKEEPPLGEMLLNALMEDGIDVRLKTTAEKVSARDGNKLVDLSDGSMLEAEELLVAVGRRPRLAGLGLDSVGISAEKAVPVDAYGRAGEGLWAIGDLLGPPYFTHRAFYHGRCVAANILEPSRPFDERALPRVTFTDPEITAVGMTERQASEQGIDAVAATIPFEEVDRPYTYQRDWSGLCKMVIDKETSEVLGASAVGPLASEWIHVAGLAITARLPYQTLRDTIFQFPTFAEVMWKLGEELDRTRTGKPAAAVTV